MKLVYLLIWGSMLLFGASAVWALVWAIRHGEMSNSRQARKASLTMTSLSAALPTHSPGGVHEHAVLRGDYTESHDEQISRVQIDRSCRQTVLGYYVSALCWLLIGSLAAIITSIKLHHPELLADWEWFTFGRIRPVHLNTVVYGWSSMVGIGTLLWLEARLCKVRLPYPVLLPSTVLVWNLAVIWGVVELLSGNSTGVEWLEFPVPVLILFAYVLAVLFRVSLKMFRERRVRHTYVSQWYLFASTLWFPILYLAAVLLPTTGSSAVLPGRRRTGGTPTTFWDCTLRRWVSQRLTI